MSRQRNSMPLGPTKHDIGWTKLKKSHSWHENVRKEQLERGGKVSSVDRASEEESKKKKSTPHLSLYATTVSVLVNAEMKNKKKQTKDYLDVGTSSSDGLRTPRLRSASRDHSRAKSDRLDKGRLQVEVLSEMVRAQTPIPWSLDEQPQSENAFTGSTSNVGGSSACADDKPAASKRYLSKQELYTDKDRAAAVVLGTRDIKVSLQDKIQRERHVARPDETNFDILFVTGEKELRKNDPQSALKFLDKAMKIRTGNKQVALCRSRCLMRLNDFEAALRDAEDVLKMDSRCDAALHQKAEILYSKGDFEFALVYYHRANRVRPECKKYKLGIQKATQAINRIIGPKSGLKLRDPDLHDDDKRNEARKPSKTEKHVLGSMRTDQVYLENLAKKSRKERCSSLKEHTKEALTFLKGRKEYWCRQQPLSATYPNRRRSCVSVRSKSAPPIKAVVCTETPQAKTVIKKQRNINPKIQINLLLRQIDQEMFSNSDKCLAKCEKLLDILHGVSVEAVPNKNEIICSTYSSIGAVKLERADYDGALKYHKLDLSHAEKFALDEAKSRALDNVGRTHAVCGNFQYAINTWQTKIQLCKLPIEKAWLHHELGQCHLELGDVEAAKKYAKDSLDYAEQAGDTTWLMNANVLLAQIEVLSKNYAEAIGLFQQGLTLAQNGNKAVTRAIKQTIKKLSKVS